MPDVTLTPEPFLGGYAERFPGAELTEVSDRALVSIAVPLGDRHDRDAALQAALGAAFPAPGTSSRTQDDDAVLLGLAPDQALALLPQASGLAVDALAARLGDHAYCTEQSDAWVMLRLDGPNARAALERVCPLDLHDAAFPEGRVARTMMEHLGAIIFREGAERFLLMSASSSARSFLHALQVSIRNVA